MIWVTASGGRSEQAGCESRRTTHGIGGTRKEREFEKQKVNHAGRVQGTLVVVGVRNCVLNEEQVACVMWRVGRV